MGSQVFRMIPPEYILFDLLDSVCETEQKNFIVNETTFRLLNRADKLNDFCKSLSQYYHKSKIVYLENHRNYNSFLTILRQLCKVLCIGYVSRVQYSHSTYSKSLEIFVPRHGWKVREKMLADTS